MGLLIERDAFSDAEFVRFADRLHESLEVLEEVLADDDFGGEEPTTLGGEIELFLVDDDGRPRGCNLDVIESCDDERITVEINRYNIELNLTPQTLAGRPFTGMLEDANAAFAKVRGAASLHGAAPVAIGMLPTLTVDDLGPEAMTDLPRYRALNQGIQRYRNGVPLKLSVAGTDVLNMESEDVTPEGANTSAQFHLKVQPRDFAATFNAAQLATAPVLALCGNSPFFLAKRLWDETRIAIFQQATDDRGVLAEDDWGPLPRVSFGRGWARRGAFELFSESVALHRPLLPVLSEESPRDAWREGRMPGFDELRLHHGTVWRWNRPVLDCGNAGHLRIEFRSLPAGPTMVDTIANGLFLMGLTLGLAPKMEGLLPGLPFPYARENFFRAAQNGLDAELLWPTDRAPSPRALTLKDLMPRLFDLATEGLLAHGVEPAEIRQVVDTVRGRLESGQTGARWQRDALAHFEHTQGRSEALSSVLHHYRQRQQTGAPVHTWAKVDASRLPG